VLGLSLSLGARIAIVQAGHIPEKADDPRALLMAEALRTLGRHGDRVGAVLALETGLESGAVLCGFLERFDTGGLGVNLDPGNLLMHDFDPSESARALRGKVVHTHATDARRASASRSTQGVPLGHGDIDWTHYLTVLEEVGYRGWLTIDRQGAGNGVAGVAADVAFLRRLAGSPG
jgi:sugar phosphate isomerase/epimerase